MNLATEGAAAHWRIGARAIHGTLIDDPQANREIPRDMVQETGWRLASCLRDLRSTTNWPIAVTQLSGGTAWSLSGSQWQARVVIVPGRWLGIDLDVHDGEGEAPASYSIDTDLYDISQEAHRSFAEQIEADIVDLLGDLREQRVVCGYESGTFILLIPTGQ